MHRANLFKGPVDGINLIHAHYESHAFKSHLHFDYHIGLIEKGQQIFHSRGSEHRIGPGCIQLMMPEQVHDSQTLLNEGFISRIFCISDKWIEKLTGDSGFSNLNTFRSSFVEDQLMFRRLLSLHHVLENKNIAKLAIDSIPFEVFSDVISRHSKGKLKDPLKLGGKSISMLKDYVMANLQEKISLQHLAEMCDLSESNFLRHFKKAVGLTPYNWLLLLRLAHAMELLKSGKRSTDVALMIGFYDQSHFIHAFRRIYGLKPRQVQTSGTR